MSSLTRRIAPILPLVALLTGCANLGRFQSARTVPAGDTDVWIAGGYVYNEHNAERGTGTGNVPFEVGVRHGVTDHLDLGLQTFLGLGALLDGKYSFLERENPLALSVLTGFGAAVPGALHVPVVAQASYRVTSWFTPYAAAGYGAFWIFNVSEPEAPTSEPSRVFRRAERAGYGDGVLLACAGLEFKLASKLRVVAEYNYLQPVVNDPGDSFSFVPSHTFLAGVQFGN